METLVEQKEYNGQLISVNRRDTCRLLEVYVKRSLSLNDGDGGGPPEPSAADKWVPKPERPRRVRRHSSDPSLHLAASPDAHSHDFGFISPPAPSNLSIPETLHRLHEEVHEEEEEEKEVKPVVTVSKKTKKPSMWKSFLGLFSKKWTEDEPDGPPPQRAGGSTEVFQSRQGEQGEVTANCLPLPTGGSMKRKSRRLRSTRRRSFKKSFKKSSHKDITVSVGEAIVNVEPTYSYFEKVSEEMELIVHQVTQVNEITVMTNEEVINRIIALTKEEGDAIDEKLKDNPTLSNFFKGMSYPAFQKLADIYLEAEITPVQNQTPSLPRPAAAPELVKLAFTLDFTARLAGLSRQNVGHITGLGNRYLADRFEYAQACTDHPWSDTDD